MHNHKDWLTALGFCDRASWANCEVREKTNKMQQLDYTEIHGQQNKKKKKMSLSTWHRE